MVRFSTEELITKLLPVLDDFERSLKMSKERGNPIENGNDESGFIRGVELIYTKFKKLLETHGVKEMNVVGQPFDPNLHDALLQMPKEDVPPHTVIEQVDKGYMLHDKVIRHARVIVSTDQSGETDFNGGGAVSKFPGDDANKNETMN
jgi:molecular chaperone GrpE